MDALVNPVAQLLAPGSAVAAPSPFLIIPLSWLGGFFRGPTPEQVRIYTWARIFYGET